MQDNKWNERDKLLSGFSNSKIHKMLWKSYGCNGKSTESYNNCKQCIGSYHFIYNAAGNCISESEKPLNTYLDTSTNTYRLCYERCSTCIQGGNSYNNNCYSCVTNYHFIYNSAGKFISEYEKPSNTFLDTYSNIYRLCFIRCSKCSKEGDPSNNNCDACANNYHFIYNEARKCISESEKPPNTYLDTSTNIYRLCYESCSKCSKGGDDNKNNYDDCIKDINDNYIYHFIYNETGKCISESEKPSNTYFDEANNIFKKCYDRCSTCVKGGDKSTNNCKECLKDVNNNSTHHFVYNEISSGKCINETEKPTNAY